jgi:hypothetical protein
MNSDALDRCLVSEDSLRECDAAIRAITHDAAAGYAHLLDDAGGDAFRYYLLFSDTASARSAGFDLDETAMFYNRYYWFRRFATQRQAARGYDGGLEQQAFKLLETAQEDADWSLLESIDARAQAG